jgi:hypothetical protein
MNRILVQGFSIDVNHFETQISKNGRPFRLSGVSIVANKPSVYIKEINSYRHGTIYSFRYLDKDEFFAFEFDAFGKFIGKA